MSRKTVRNSLLAFAAVAAIGASPISAQQVLKVPDGLPDWAFNIPDKVQPNEPRPQGIVHVPGSTKEYDTTKISGATAITPDWFPDEHPSPPKVVTSGEGGRFACGTCHLMSGQGHSEAADIAGLPVPYIIREMADFKANARLEQDRMGPIARVTPDADVRQAAEYFAAIKPRPWVKVIEAADVPKTYINTAGRHRVPLPGGGTEPIGHRILETPEDPMRVELRDPHSGFIAYVPPGSIAKGEALVKSGNCSTCHGAAFRGNGDTPRLAGLQPLYLARQLFDFRFGSRGGASAETMKPVAAKMSDDDVIAISAYLGSLPPA